MILAWSKRSGLASLVVLGNSPLAHADLGIGGPEASEGISWHWEPLIVFNLCLFVWLYARGAIRIQCRSPARKLLAQLRLAAFATGIAAIALALLSPLDWLAGQLASAHMVQHLLLMMVAAPLFVLGRAGVAINAGLPHNWRNDTASLRRFICFADRVQRHPAGAVANWLIFAIVLWTWHLPAFYHAALASVIVHDLQHLTFFIAGVLFWRQVARFGRSQRANAGIGVVFLFATSLHAGVLGIFMALSPRPWYAAYAETTALWNLTPLEDQQLAGLIMWVPACMIYPAAAALLIGVWLNQLSNSRVTSAKPRYVAVSSCAVPSPSQVEDTAVSLTRC